MVARRGDRTARRIHLCRAQRTASRSGRRLRLSARDGAIGLLLSGSYGQLLDYVTFADWIFFGVTAATLFVYRRRDVHDGPRYRAPFHPVSVILFCAARLYVVAGAVASNPWNAVRGTALLAAGVPVFLFWSRLQPAT